MVRLFYVHVTILKCEDRNVGMCYCEGDTNLEMGKKWR